MVLRNVNFSFQKSLVLWLSLVICSAPSMSVRAQSGSNTPPLPRTMGALGDSISVGALAEYKRQSALWPWFQVGLLLEVFNFIAQRKMSIFESRQVAWATGLDPSYRVISHARRLAYLNPELRIYNAAVSGAVAKNVLQSQVEELSRWSRKVNRQDMPDYVTLMIGGNDLCRNRVDQMTSPSEYQEQIEDIVDRVLAHSPQTRLLVSTTPKVSDLKQFSRNWVTGFGVLKNCQKVWNLHKFCQTVTDSTQSAEDRRRVQERMATYHQILRDVVNRRRRVYGDRIRLSDKLYNYEFTKNDLAVDCFHPNFTAHQKIADFSFVDNWWYGNWKQSEKAGLKEFELRRKAYVQAELDRIRRATTRRPF